jgi:hypothetical protein
MTEQESYDEWCPEPYRRRIWTAQSQEAARAAFAAAWYARDCKDKRSAGNMVWICRNSKCWAIWDRYVVGACPACVEETGGWPCTGYSVRKLKTDGV